MSEQPETKPARRPRKVKIIAIAAALALVLIAAALITKPFAGSDAVAQTGDDPYALTFDGDQFDGNRAADPVRTEPVAQRDSEEKYASACVSCAKNHRLAEMPAASTTTRVAPGAPSSAEVEKLAKKQQKFANGTKVVLQSNGQALAPMNAPDAVQNVIAAGNQIANFPYIWGGGHGSFQARGYDCSGSVSYALKGANLVDVPMASGQFMNWGEPGPGKWITVYANEGHMFMLVGGLRFDTSFRDGPYGSRWQTAKRSYAGFTVRHPPGL
jgi:cell wall-associated NlpC family hydrolase